VVAPQNNTQCNLSADKLITLPVD